MESTESTRVTALGEAYFRARNEADPFGATVFGVAGYDDQVPDPSRAADDRLRATFEGLAAELAAIDPATLGDGDRVDHSVLSGTLAGEIGQLASGLSEIAVSASIAGVVPLLVGTLPAAPLGTPEADAAYLRRLGGLGEYLDRRGQRHLDALADGRTPTALGVTQAVAQIDAYLRSDLKSDPMVAVSGAEELVTTVVRPALRRYRGLLAAHLLPAGRGEDEAGVCHVPAGDAGYLAEVRAHTTTDLGPEEIHTMGVRLVAQLREEFAELGGRVLGTTDTDEVLQRLRNDPALRFATGEEIVEAVTTALRRAEASVPDWFRDYDTAPCEVRVMDAAEAENSVLGYYQPPSADGRRAGAHVINTSHPTARTRFEYEALAFHESVPGHHLQIAAAQRLTGVPDYRRLGYVTAHGEGWGLYAERLADRMGLYTSEESRLGMVSFDAWRACRLVVDTGIHAFGWSRQRAIDYMLDNTALSTRNVTNEVDRYIACPGQALAYMVGKVRIEQLRDRMAAALGPGFDLKAYHDVVLGNGAVPLTTLAALVDRAVSDATSSTAG
ncbi:DUF885 domain-containing protein [Hamadaea tsunoensis]|uniref:DUF885 domain-containing protein n=1 Tax=Hamadaea tsunoensis TaxID=53368 RepID=UPI0003FFEC1D|nr:DUF885 domain-containing protein [Hamadaea tsunoensis]